MDVIISSVRIKFKAFRFSICRKTTAYMQATLFWLGFLSMLRTENGRLFPYG
ncbi:hypothetical protein BC829DRAFT_378910 [Chytridium lagenaria]|nr:hypothetical protein BC829DRAFT_378910 [Chytridium lagenaria]